MRLAMVFLAYCFAVALAQAQVGPMFPGPGPASFGAPPPSCTSIGTAGANAQTATSVLTTTGAVPAGAAIVVASTTSGDVFTNQGGNISGITDSAGNVYTNVRVWLPGAVFNGAVVELWVTGNAKAIATGGTITVSYTASLSTRPFVWSAVAVNNISGLDVSNITTGITTTTPTVSVTPTQSPGLAIGFVGGNSTSAPTITEASGWANSARSTAFNQAGVFQSLNVACKQFPTAVAQTYNPTYSAAFNNAADIIVTFPAVQPVGSCIPNTASNTVGNVNNTSIMPATDVDVLALQHFDNNGTDTSIWNRTGTLTGTASFSSVQSKFGGFSLLNPTGVATAYLLPLNQWYETSFQDWTIEWWYFANNTTQTGFNFFTDNNQTQFGLDNVTNGYFVNLAATNPWAYTAPIPLTTGWHHVVWQRRYDTTNGGAGAGWNWYFWLDGQARPVTNTTPQGAGGPAIGMVGGFTGGPTTNAFRYNAGFNGYIDELRISQVARYGGSPFFTPPTVPFCDPQSGTTAGALLGFSAHQNNQFTPPSPQPPSITTFRAAPAGSTIVITIGGQTASGSPITAMTDSAGNTYTRARLSSSGLVVLDQWYAKNVTALPAGGTISFTGTGTVISFDAAAIFLTGMNATTPLDVQNSVATSGVSPTISTTTTRANEVMVGAWSGYTWQCNAANPPVRPMGAVEAPGWQPWLIRYITDVQTCQQVTTYISLKSAPTAGSQTFNPTIIDNGNASIQNNGHLSILGFGP